MENLIAAGRCTAGPRETNDVPITLWEGTASCRLALIASNKNAEPARAFLADM